MILSKKFLTIFWSLIFFSGSSIAMEVKQNDSYVTLENLSNHCIIYARLYEFKENSYAFVNNYDRIAIEPGQSIKIKIPEMWEPEVETEKEKEEEGSKFAVKEYYFLFALDEQIVQVEHNKNEIIEGTKDQKLFEQKNVKLYEVLNPDEHIKLDVFLGKDTPLWATKKICRNIKDAELIFVQTEKYPSFEIGNKTDKTLFFAQYFCQTNPADPIHMFNCVRTSNVFQLEKGKLEKLENIVYDSRSEKIPEYFKSILIFSLFEDDLKESRYEGISIMRQFIRGTTRQQEGFFNLIENKNLQRIYVDHHPTGLMIHGYSWLPNLSKWFEKQLYQYAPYASDVLSKTHYNQFAAPIKEMIERIRQNDAIRKTTHEVLIKSDLNKGEKDSIKLRSEINKVALEKLIGSYEKYPNIALCLSGGGYRAMISSLGFVQGLQEDDNILDAAKYMAALSGSSWFMIKYLSQESQNISDLRKNIGPQLQEGSETEIGILYPGNFAQLIQVIAAIFPKFVFNQTITLTDIYGVALGYNLFAKLEDKKVQNGFSYFKNRVQTGQVPFPIVTAISELSGDKLWFEFTPFEVGTMGLNPKYDEKVPAFIPTESLGKRFINGKSVDDALELPIHNLMGIFGSAFSLKGADFAKHLKLDDIKQALKETGFEPLAQELKNKIDEFVKLSEQHSPEAIKFIGRDEEMAGRIPGGIIPNFLYKIDHPQLDKYKNDKIIELRDAGIEFNLPFPPLLRKEREVNLIIAFDASSNVLKEDASFKLFKDAEAYCQIHNLKFPEITNDLIGVLNKQNLTVIGDPDDPNALTIIYVPIIKNINLNPPLDKFEPTDQEFTGTFNFSYTKEQFNSLAEYARLNAFNLKPQIIDIIKRKTKALNKSFEQKGA